VLGLRTDPDDVVAFDDLRELRILGEEAIAWVDRVRVDDFVKIRAQVWPASGLRSTRARSRLKITESRRIFSMSAFANVSNDNKCFIFALREFPKESLYPKSPATSSFFFTALVPVFDRCAAWICFEPGTGKFPEPAGWKACAT